MIIYKTQKDIEIMVEGGRILGSILKQVAEKVEPGVGTKDLNQLAEKLIYQNNGQPAFKGYKISEEDKPFPTTLCTSINHEIVHAPAEPNRILKEGDIIGLDIGMEYQGMYTDTAVTVAVGKVDSDTIKLLKVTQECLNQGIYQFKLGNNLADVAKAIQDYVEQHNFSIVRELVGHGVGKKVHEDPRVPNHVTEEAKYIEIKKGMTIAIEPMVNIGDWQIEILSDGWTFATRDKSLSAQFEHTVAIDHNGEAIIITQR